MNTPDDTVQDDNSWYRDSNYPMDWWQRDVENDETMEGYNRWLVMRYELDDKEVPQAVLDQVYSYQDAGLDQNGMADISTKYRDRYPLEDWKREVEDLDTKNSYEGWLMSMVQLHDEEWEQEQEATANAHTLDAGTPAAPAKANRPRV